MTRSWLRSLAIAAVLAPFVWPLAARAGELTAAGARLGPVVVDPAAVTVEHAVTLSADTPLSTHVTARTGSGRMLQRTNLGYWIPWSGNLDEMVDNGFAAHGDRLVFKVLKDEDMRGELFPIRIMIGYRTTDAFKFGIFELRDTGTGTQR